MSVITVLDLIPNPDYCEKEVLRYAGCKEPKDELCALIKNCYDQLKDKLTYKICYRVLEVSVKDGVCDFGCFDVRSDGLAGNLKGCKKALVFAATIGVEVDRIIGKYNHISPASALFMQALGSERIEALCDLFCQTLKKQYNTKPRFSPGYGDLPLEVQRKVFDVLECSKYIGLSLNDSLLMSPSKSVTAFVGICEKEVKE